jgi:flagellin
MSTSINTNISALAAQSSLRKTGLTQASSMERLSTGVRINSAKDDAAGLAISTRMTANIRGLSAAIRNANDGISLTQTAEGSLSAIQDNLQRIRELAVQASNTGNNNSDRAALNAESAQLIQEINRVADNTAFNGIKLLDGSFQNQSLQVGAGNELNDRITISIGNAKANALGVGGGSSYSTSLNSTKVAGALASGELSVNGFMVGATTDDGVSSSSPTASAIALASAINGVSGSTGVTAVANATKTNTVYAGTNASTALTANLAAGDIVINGVNVGSVTFDTAGADANAKALANATNIVAEINKISEQTGVTASLATRAINLTAADGRDIVVKFVGAEATTAMTGLGASVTAASTVTTKAGPALGTFSGVAIADDEVRINGVNIGAIHTAASAVERGAQVSAAVNKVSSQTGVTATFDTTSGKVLLTALDGRNITTSVRSKTGGDGAVTSNRTMLAHDNGGTANNTARTDTTLTSNVTLRSSSKDGITLAGVGSSALGNSGLTNKSGLSAANVTAGAGVSTVDLTTVSGAQTALSTLDKAINTVTDSRAAMGAYQNRLTASISNLETTSMNLQASRSRILDTDYAKETTNLAKSQIITQAATAMLAQANQSSQSVLALLK